MTGNAGSGFGHVADVPRAVEGKCEGEARCRCGRRLRAGDPGWAVSGVAPSLDALFRDEVFCGRPCLRAFLLEALETVGTLDRPETAKLVSDLHFTFLELQRILDQTGASRSTA